MAYTLSDSIVRASIPALVLTVFALARRYLPPKPSTFEGVYTTTELNSRFKVTQWFVGAGMLASGTAIWWALRSVLEALSHVFADAEGPSDIVLLPQSATWWILPSFAAIALAWETTLAIWSAIGCKDEAALYNH